MSSSLVREEPDEVESLMSVSEAESGEAIPWLRLTIPVRFVQLKQANCLGTAGKIKQRRNLHGILTT